MAGVVSRPTYKCDDHWWHCLTLSSSNLQPGQQMPYGQVPGAPSGGAPPPPSSEAPPLPSGEAPAAQSGATSTAGTPGVAGTDYSAYYAQYYAQQTQSMTPEQQAYYNSCVSFLNHYLTCRNAEWLSFPFPKTGIQGLVSTIPSIPTASSTDRYRSRRDECHGHCLPTATTTAFACCACTAS